MIQVDDSVGNLKRGFGSMWAEKRNRDSVISSLALAAQGVDMKSNPMATKTNKSGSEVDGTQLTDFFVEVKRMPS